MRVKAQPKGDTQTKGNAAGCGWRSFHGRRHQSAAAAPAMAEGTAGVESAGKTEKAAAARPEALGPGRIGKHGARLFEVVRWYRPMDA